MQSTATTHLIGNLLPFTEYTVQIHGCNMAGMYTCTMEPGPQLYLLP